MSKEMVTRIDPAEPADNAISARLLGVRGSIIGRHFPLTQDVLSIGRLDDNSLVLGSDHVSRHHARIIRRDNHYLIEDLDSSNGVCVNGRRVQPRAAHELSHGDSLQIGDCMFVFLDTTAQESPQRMSPIRVDENLVRREVDALFTELR